MRSMRNRSKHGLNLQAVLETLESRRLLAVPVGVADTVVVDKFVAKNIEVLANDTWDSGKMPTVSIVTAPAHGTYAIEADQSITYTPASGYAGADSLIYRVYDGAGYSGNTTVAITVNERDYIYVNQATGNDSNNGTSSGTALKTIEAAQNLVQTLRALHPIKSVSVFIVGEYRLTQRITFDSGDSGSAIAPVTYYGQSNAVIKGSKLLTGLSWTDAPGISGVKVTNLGAQLTQTQLDNLGSLFVNGTRAIRAREPDVGYYTIVSTDPNTSQPDNRTNSFKYNGTNILSTWTNLTDVEIVSYAQWHESRMPIASVDTANKIVRIQGEIAKPTADYMGDYGMNQTTGVGDGTTRYYVENVLQGLDIPGEWYLDRVGKKLYYKPLAGQNIITATFEVPILNQLIKMFSTQYVGFSGITFTQTDWSMPGAGQPGNSATLFQDEGNTLAAIDLSGTSNISFANCTFTNNGYYAVKSELKATGTSVVNSVFTANGGGSIMVGVNPDWNTAAYGASKGALNNEMISFASSGRIALNTSHDNNAVWRASPDIIFTRSGYNRITANTVYNTAYHGIQVGWFDTDANAKGRNHILWNTVHNAMRVMYDGAGIYAIGNQPGTAIMANTVHDVMYTSNHLYRYYNPSDTSGHSKGPIVGIYTDETSGNMLVKGNIIHDINIGIFANDSKGMSYNSNIIVDPQSAVFYMGYHADAPDLGTDNSWQSNVVSWTRTTTNPVFVLAGQVWWANDGDSGKAFALNNNIYKYGPVVISSYGNLSRIQTTNLGGGTHENNALVTTQTLFVNPTGKDYRIIDSAISLVQGKGFSAKWLFAATGGSLLINDGSAQRSMVTSLTVTFDQAVRLAADAIAFIPQGSNIAISVTPTGGYADSFAFTFSGTGIIGDSLPDGAYTLSIRALSVTDPNNLPLTGGDLAFRFHRLFGDVNGDRIVNMVDLAAFKRSLNRPGNYVWYFNCDGKDTVINNSDYLDFRKRLTKPLI